MDAKELLNLIGSSDKILVTSHISPDPDAICSVLLFATSIKTNFPGKQISIVLEEKPSKNLDFLEGYKEIHFGPLPASIKQVQPGTFIVLDANNFERVTREKSVGIKEWLADSKVKTCAIDHHEEADKDSFGVFINHHRSSTTEELYILLFDELKLKKPAGYAQTTMLGIVSDTNRFKYKNPFHRQTFAIISNLIEAGVEIEDIENRIERVPLREIQILKNLMENLIPSNDGYSYSFIDDDLIPFSSNETGDHQAMLEACNKFVDDYIRNLENNLWGFIVYRDVLGGPNAYSVSLRSIGGVKDVSEIARRLGGGGHKSAAGAKFQSGNVKEAVAKVRAVISGAENGD